MNGTAEIITTEAAILALVSEHPDQAHLNGHYRTWALVQPAGRPDVLCAKRTVERLLLTRRLAFGTASNLVITKSGLELLHQASPA